MTIEHNSNKQKVRVNKSSKKRLFLFILIAIVASIVFWRIFLYKSVDEQLAEIQAAYAIPDSENAAFYYREYFSDVDNVNAIEDISYYSSSGNIKPWKDSEFPELAESMEMYHDSIQTLIEISKKKKAFFPIYPSYSISEFSSLATLMRKSARALSWAAANDIAEGRYEEALGKYKCQLQISIHLQQQPMTVYRLVGLAIQGLGLSNLSSFIMDNDITQEQQNIIEDILANIKNYSEPDQEIVNKLDNLAEKKERSLLPFDIRIQAWLEYLVKHKEIAESYNKLHKRSLSHQNVMEILIALKQYKIKYNQWPKSLNEIRTSVADDVLIDPINGSSYIYKLNDGDFILYSKAENNIDNEGKKNFGGDDWLFWPMQLTQTQTQSTKSEQPDPNEGSTDDN